MTARRASLISRLLLLAGAALCPAPALAAAGASGGLTLVEAPGARAASLGEAFSAVPNDLTAMAYNPAALASLESAQASVSYEAGLLDDTYGRVDAALPGLGLSAAYFSAGRVDLLENGVTRTVNAQTDLAVSLGGALRFGRLALGAAGKYLSSVLAESDRATAWAGDAGAVMDAGSARISVAAQNFGSRVTYVDTGDPLPRIARAGVAVPVHIRRATLTVLGEAPYFLNEREWRPGAGLEVHVGPLALRGGYRTGARLEGLSLGAGFALGTLSLDYAFGFVDNLSARQRVSLGFRFGKASRPDETLRIDETAYQRRRDARESATSGRPATPARRPHLGGLR